MADAFLQHLGVKPDENVVLGQDMSFEEARDKLGIMKTPTMILFDDSGNEIDRVSGVGQSKIVELFTKAGKLN
jgi:thioredoxin-related protein